MRKKSISTMRVKQPRTSKIKIPRSSIHSDTTVSLSLSLSLVDLNFVSCVVFPINYWFLFWSFIIQHLCFFGLLLHFPFIFSCFLCVPGWLIFFFFTSTEQTQNSFYVFASESSICWCCYSINLMNSLYSACLVLFQLTISLNFDSLFPTRSSMYKKTFLWCYPSIFRKKA